MPRPDFFFVGHPRSGSGLLDSYLAGHPDIFMARKELHYFGADLRYHSPPRTLQNYLSHFDGVKPQHKRIGESSTWYLISQRAAEEIHAFTGEARIVMMLRNPVSWLHSLHSHLLFSGDEDIESFEEALAAEADRRAGRRLSAASIPACALFYRGLVRYADQVERYLRVFGADRVHILILDEFQKDPRAAYRGLLEFLGLRTDFPGMAGVLDASERSRNSNREVRSAALRRFIIEPRRRRVLEGVDPAPFPGFGVALRALRRANLRFAERAPLDPALRERLAAELEPEVERFEALLGRRLPGWHPKRG